LKNNASLTVLNNRGYVALSPPHCDTGVFDQQFTDETGLPEAEELEKEESLTESPIMQELGILEKEESNLNKVNNKALF